MRRLALAALLVALADAATPYLAGERDDARHLSAVMSIEQLIDASPAAPAWLLVGDSTGGADVDRHRLGGGRWLQLAAVADLAPKHSADAVERYIRRRGAPLGVLAVHAFPTWYLTPPRSGGPAERAGRASALVRLGEAAGFELGAPTLRDVQRQVQGPPSRHWRRRLGELPAESLEAARRLSRLSQEHGFPLVFVETPVREDVLEDADRAKRAELRKALGAFPHRLVVIEDEAPAATMRDEMHMTREGRREFTRRLAQSLSEAGRSTPIGLPAISRRP